MPSHRVVATQRDAQPQAKILIYWNSRRKVWELVIISETPRQRWTWSLTADSTVELDAGTGWLLLKAVQEALEAQLY